MRVAIVVHPFGDYGTGHRITDQAEIDELRAGERAHQVVISDHDVPDAPEGEAAGEADAANAS